ncbi:MAG: hypothetical protein FJ222_05115 [Lentisphaerae bacterium]|nr:hypothetical protein [Lentisphaerota bacterium]
MDDSGRVGVGGTLCAVITALILAGCATTGVTPSSRGSRVPQDPALERAVEVFLTECLHANVDDVAKMKAALGVSPIDTQGQAAGPQMDNRLGQTVMSLLDERQKNRTDPLRLIKQEYVDSPGPYWNQAVLLLKVMGYKCLETEAL